MEAKLHGEGTDRVYILETGLMAEVIQLRYSVRRCCPVCLPPVLAEPS